MGKSNFSVKTLNQIIFHLKVPMEVPDNGIYLDWFILGCTISLGIVINSCSYFFNIHDYF